MAGVHGVHNFVPGKLYRYSKTYTVLVQKVLEVGVERFRCRVITNTGRISDVVMWVEDWEEVSQ